MSPSEQQEQQLFQFQVQFETASFEVAPNFLKLLPFGLTYARIHACLKSDLYFKVQTKTNQAFSSEQRTYAVVFHLQRW